MGSGKKFYHNITPEDDFAFAEKWPVHGGQLQLHQASADAGAEVKAFNAYVKWCSDQAQVDGHQQETINTSIASTNATIEKFAGNSRRQHCSHKCRHREICRQGRKMLSRTSLLLRELDHIGGLGVDRSECRERKRW